MGIHHKYPTPRTQTFAYLTAYTTVITYLALGSLLCRFMLANAVAVVVIVMVVALMLYVLNKGPACIKS